MRVPVISSTNIPLMPTKPSRARRWIKAGIAVGKFNKLGIFYATLAVGYLADEPMKNNFLVGCELTVNR
ncbi:RRXRR domain-containing protein [Nostoc sp.]|uniref:RRXRR domain-containing protein n=1 Tax=Nostoc sp. TaxID=1180 RepID=UPI002FFD0A79